MAGDWIKMRTDLAEDPAVISMAAELGIDDDSVVGKLHRIWSWADRQSRDGHAVGVTGKWVDRYVHCDGFASVMQSVGWLVVDGSGLQFPNFERHNGKSAKQRALGTVRQQAHRSNVTENITQPSRSERDKSVTREEKRREDISTAKAVESAPKKRATKRCPEEFDLNDTMRDWAVENAPAVDVDLATAKFKDHTFKTGITDWKAAWRNWLRNEQTFHGSRPASNAPARQSFAERDEKRKADRMAQFMGLSLGDERNVIDVTPDPEFLEIER